MTCEGECGDSVVQPCEDAVGFFRTVYHSSPFDVVHGTQPLDDSRGVDERREGVEECDAVVTVKEGTEGKEED